MMPLDLPRNAILGTRNLVCSLRRKGLDCVVLSIRGAYPEQPPQREPLPFPFSHLPLFPAEVSLTDMRAALEMIGGDRRVQTVVLRFDALHAGLPALYSLRRMLLDLRATGKRLVAWLPNADTWEYYLASACDDVILPPAGHLFALGLRAEPMFLKDMLALAGIEADFEAIAEYKVAPDTFRRTTMSEPHREMLDSMLGSLFDEIVTAIAEGRGLEAARVRELIDAMPLSAAEAVEAGLVDAVLYEDELAGRLESLPHEAAGRLESLPHEAAGRLESLPHEAAGRLESLPHEAAGGRLESLPHEAAGGRLESLPHEAAGGRLESLPHEAAGGRLESLPHEAAAGRLESLPHEAAGGRLESLPHEAAGRLESLPHTGLLTWREAARWLRTPIKWNTRQAIGVVSLEGLIVPGRSRRVPVPVPLPMVEAQAGAETVVQALRQAEADRHIAAVIFYVETPGGSALASDLLCREVRRLRERKPVVVLMGGQATSGGYYVAAPASRIVARPTTLTGSIGIWGGKVVLAGLYQRLKVGFEPVQRGAMAGLYAETAPFSDEERARIRRDLGENYARFKARVAEGRGMTEEQVEGLARGRVWTGAQARGIGLVDELGDFQTALALAKELAGLKPDQEYTVVQVGPPRHELLPPPFPQPGRSAGLSPFSLVGRRAGDEGSSPFSLIGRRAGDEGGWLLVLLDALQGLAHERVWALAPWTVQIRG